MMKNKDSTWLDAHLAKDNNPHSVRHSVLTKDVRVAGVSLPHNAVVMTERPAHPFDALMTPARDETSALPAHAVPGDKDEKHYMQRITTTGGWGGDQFSPIATEHMPVSVVAYGVITYGRLVKGAMIYGSDHDHGNETRWSVQDYDIEIPSDTFPRSTSLMRTIKRDDVVVMIGHLTKLDAMRYRDHRGTLADSMVTGVVIPRTLDALLEHLNKGDVFLNRKLTADDLEFNQAGYDDRIDWVTVWVKVRGFGVVGCIDGIIPDTLGTEA